jgi:malate dehydrogenase
LLILDRSSDVIEGHNVDCRITGNAGSTNMKLVMALQSLPKKHVQIGIEIKDQENCKFMASSISIIGASGAVGTTLAGQILRSSLLKSGDRLQLVGRGVESSSAKLLSVRIDLMDAFDHEGVDIEVVANIEDVDADIVVLCAGISSQAKLIDRRDWGRANLALYEEIAETCAQRIPDSFFIIVSNPVELAVNIFSEKLGRERVIGMGAEQDSLRFARAIAHDLGVRRDTVAASVLGEHGQAMVPLWSTVEVIKPNAHLMGEIERIREQSNASPLEQRVAHLRSQVMDLIQVGQINEAYEATRRALPDARIFVQPLITWHTMQSTPNATANATLRFLIASLSDTPHPLHGQVFLSGDIFDIKGVCGVPVDVSRQGWTINRMESLDRVEQERVRKAAASIKTYLASLTVTQE